MTDLVARESTALSTGFTFTPHNFEEAFKFASIIAKTEMVPKHFQGKPEAIVVAMAWSAELGVPVMQGLQGIAVINGRPSVWGDLALSMVMKHPSFVDCLEYFEGEGDQLTAVCVMQRKGKEDKIYKFGMADAKKAQLLGKQGPWTQFPKRMMQMRARGFAMRDQFPDALRGMNLAEESADMEIDVTPRATVTMPKSRKQAAQEILPTPEAQQQAPEPQYQHEAVEIDEETGEVLQAASEPEKPAPQPQKARDDGAPPTLQKNHIELIRKQLTSAGRQEAELLRVFLYDALEEIPFSLVNDLLKWIKDNAVQS